MPAQWGLIFSYSWEEHEEMELPQKLEVVRNILDIRAPEWKKRIRINNRSETDITRCIDIMRLSQDDFPVTVKWAWIRKEDFVAHSWWARLEFYWIGLTDNLRYRSILLRLTSRLKIISQEARALFEEMLDEEDEALDEIDANRTSAHEHVFEHAKTAARQRHFVSCKVTSGTYHDLSKAEDTLRDLEALLQMAFTEKTGPLTYQSESTVSTDKLFLMAGCPFESLSKSTSGIETKLSPLATIAEEISSRLCSELQIWSMYCVATFRARLTRMISCCSNWRSCL
jgi:hypothetical protein